jgi:hypothetical protein
MKGAVKLGLAGAAAAAAASMLLVLQAGAETRGREVGCRNNLRWLGVMVETNWQLLDPAKTGRAFWQEVRVAQYRDTNGNWKPIRPDPFTCPVHGRTASRREAAEAIDYRGPKKVPQELREYGAAAPLGADRPGNHASGGWVLRMDASVTPASPVVERRDGGDPAWAAAADALTD